jgi:rod shape determining protein RodA
MQRRIDLDIIVAVMILTLIGLIMIYSTANVAVLTKQVAWLGFSLIACLACTRISIRVWQNLAPFLYIAAVVLLVMLLFLSNTYPKRWFQMGWINMQPAEFAKLATILLLAQILASRKKFKHYSAFLIPLIVVLIPAGLIFMEPDFGAAQIFLPILVVMLYWSGLPAPKILIFFSPVLSAAASLSIYVWVVYFILRTVFLYFRRPLVDLEFVKRIPAAAHHFVLFTLGRSPRDVLAEYTIKDRDRIRGYHRQRFLVRDAEQTRISTRTSY